MITGLLILLPILFSFAVFSLRDGRQAKWLAFAVAVAELGLAIYGLNRYIMVCNCQLGLNLDWIGSAGISLRFGMDGISLLLVLLTAFLIPVIIACSRPDEYLRPAAFYALILLTETAFIGVFTSLNGLVFYIFWEMALIPAYFLCAVWGGNDRIRITFKFFIYTFAGSLFMLVALIWLYYRTPLPHSFDLDALYSASLTAGEKTWIAAAFFLAFAIKIPLFPFHTWQPDTYTVSPSPVTMVLAGIMLKMGLYGLFRFLLPVCPGILLEWGYPAMILTIAGIVYSSVIAIRQPDMKRLVAYSSIAHVGLIAAGILSANIRAMEGAAIQMVAHGINITGLFIIIGFIERRTGTRDMDSLGGLAVRAPWLAFFFLVFVLSSIGLPLTGGFVGEFLLLMGIFEYSVGLAAVAGLTIILSAVYMLRMFQRTMLGPTEALTAEVRDLTRGEILVLFPLVILVFWIGVYPSLFLKLATPAIYEILSYL